MASKHYTNLSALGVDREGLTKKQFKSHLTMLQQQIRDLQEELRVLTGGGRGQVPATQKSFRLAAPNTSVATDKLEVPSSLRTTTKSRVKHDLVTKAELESRVSTATTGTGYLALTGDQSVLSGNKDFGSISLQREFYALTPGTRYSTVDLSGATYWNFAASNSVNANVIIDGIQPPVPDTNMLRIIVWRSTTSNLELWDSTHASNTAATDHRILTLGGTTSTTTGLGSYILIYDISANKWIVLARTA